MFNLGAGAHGGQGALRVGGHRGVGGPQFGLDGRPAWVGLLLPLGRFRTAVGAAVRLTNLVPSASMRAASLSHLSAGGGCVYRGAVHMRV